MYNEVNYPQHLSITSVVTLQKCYIKIFKYCNKTYTKYFELLL